MSGYRPAACGRQQKSIAPPCEAPRTFKASAHSLKCLHELHLGWKGLGPPLHSVLSVNRQEGCMHKVRVRVRVAFSSSYPRKGSPWKEFSDPLLDLG